jgi:hypothetical protein
VGVLGAEPASPSSAGKPETEALPPISPEAHSALARSSSTPIDPADTDDRRRDEALVFLSDSCAKALPKKSLLKTPPRKTKTAKKTAKKMKREQRTPRQAIN